MTTILQPTPAALKTDEEFAAVEPARAKVDWSVRDLGLVLTSVTCLVFWNSFAGQFVFDDILQITDNPNLRRLWPLADWQRPLGYFTFQLNYAAGGLNPWGYHLVNLVIHAVNGLLLFDLARRCIERGANGELCRSQARYLAFAIALLWLVHPLTTTAVTYTVQRLESLMALWFLACLTALVRCGDGANQRWWQLGAIAAMLLGVLTKEVMITCLPVAILFDRAFVARSWRGVWQQRRLFYALLALPLVWTIFTMRMTDANEYAAGFGFRGVTPWEYLRSQPLVLLHYLRLSFWPDPLVLDYGWPVASDPLSIYVPGAIIVGLLCLSSYALWKKPPVGAVALAAFLVLAPSSSIMPIADLCFEHRMYLPLMSIISLLVIGAHQLIARWVKPEQQGAVAFVCLLLIACGLGYRTMLRNADYANPLQLWEKNVAARPEHGRPRLLLAMLYDRAGRMSEAGAQYQAAVAVDPRYFKGLLNLGGWHFRQGDFAHAADLFRRASEVEPGNPAGYVQRARALLELGDTADARQFLETALQLDSREPSALRSLAWLLATSPIEGERDGSRAIRLLAQLPADPQGEDAWRLDVLAAAQAEQGEFEAACSTMQKGRDAAERQRRPAALQEQLRLRAESYQRRQPWRLSKRGS